MRREKKLLEIITEGIDLNKIKTIIMEELEYSIDVDLFKRNLLAQTSILIAKLYDINNKIALIGVPNEPIDLHATYTKNEACKLLSVTKSKLRRLIKSGEIKARKENQRVHKPFKWSVDSYLLHGTGAMRRTLDKCKKVLQEPRSIANRLITNKKNTNN